MHFQLVRYIGAIGALVRWRAGALVRWCVGALVRWCVGAWVRGFVNPWLPIAHLPAGATMRPPAVTLTKMAPSASTDTAFTSRSTDPLILPLLTSQNVRLDRASTLTSEVSVLQLSTSSLWLAPPVPLTCGGGGCA